MSDAIGASRRDMIKAGAAAATWGLFGLSLPNLLFSQEALGAAPDLTTKKYDAVISCFMTGGPSQTDTWDPKADPSPVAGATAGQPGYVSKNNVFNTLSLGKNDIYGKPIWLSDVLRNLANLVNTDPASYGLGIVRSLHHGNGAHTVAEGFMNCFWQSPVADLYPSTSASMNLLLQDQVSPPSGIGLPAVSIVDSQGVRFNDSKGSATPVAFQVNGSKASPATQMLSLPPGVSAARYDRRRAIFDAIEPGYAPTRPDQTVKAWTKAWRDAHAITKQGKAAQAFDLTSVTLLPGGPTARARDLENLTLAQQLVLNGVPYVSVAIGGNDTHANNRRGVQMNWGDAVDPAFAQMAKNLKTAGKRVLCVFMGDFGRTPATVASGRDGRDHHPSGFSAGLLSIGQPAFKTTAVGDTGPDGVWTARSATPLKDLVYPSALGGMIYRAMGFPPTKPAYFIRNAVGNLAPPVDPTYQGTAAGQGLWLSQRFGLA